MLLWLWCRLAAAVPIRPLAWEFPYAAGVALKRQKDKKGVQYHKHAQREDVVPGPLAGLLRDISVFLCRLGYWAQTEGKLPPREGT